jgi:hypothetical protein
MHITYQQFESMHRHDLGRYQDSDMTHAILFALTGAAAGPMEPAATQGSTPITVVLLPFPKGGEAAATATLSVGIDRGKEEKVLAGPSERVRALRAWIDSLPPVPHVPQTALDRDNLY